LFATAAQSLRAKQHRIAIVIASGPATRVDDPASRYWQAFWEELRRLGDVEGQNLTVDRYCGGGSQRVSPVSLAKLSATIRM
jgi:putative tryptophan/tyrosine transport system substrate-binding protein